MILLLGTLDVIGGDTCDEDKMTNDYAVKNNDRILAVYKYNDTTTI